MKTLRFFAVAGALGVLLAGCDSKIPQTKSQTQQAVSTQQAAADSASSGSTEAATAGTSVYTSEALANPGQTVSFDVPSYRVNDVRRIRVHIEKVYEDSAPVSSAVQANTTESVSSAPSASYMYSSGSSNAQPFHGLYGYQPNPQVYTAGAPLFHGLSEPCPNPQIYTPSSCGAPLPLFHGLR